MGTTHHQAGRRGGTILAAAFLAGTAAAIGVVIHTASQGVMQPFFGFPIEEAESESESVAEPELQAAGFTPAPRDEWHQPAVRPVNAEQTLAEPLPLPAPPPLVPLVPLVDLLVPPPSDLQPAVPSPAVPSATVPARPLALPTAPAASEPATAEAFVTDAAAAPSAPAAPLPGEAWTDPDGVNWVDAPGAAATARSPASGRVIDRIGERRAEVWGIPAPAGGGRRQPVAVLGERFRERLRGEGRLARALGAPHPDSPESQVAISDGWPTPGRLLDQLEQLATDARGDGPSGVAAWASGTLDVVHVALETDGPADPRAADSLLALGESVIAGMAAADRAASPAVASQARRAALAVARRVAVWRAAAAWCG